MSDVPRLVNVILISGATPAPTFDNSCTTADMILHRAAIAAQAQNAQGATPDIPGKKVDLPLRPALPLLRLGGALLFVLCVFTLSALLALAGTIVR